MPRVTAPLVGPITLNNYVAMDLPASAAPGLKLPSGKLFHFELMLPPGYDPAALYPLVLEFHPDQSGNNYYRGGGGQLSNPYGSKYRTEAFMRAHPSIICVPYADQTGGSDTVENWGGWTPDGASASASVFSGDNGPNAYAVCFLVAYLTGKYAVDPTRVYAKGFSLGGIATEYYMLKFNTINGHPPLFCAGTTTGGVLQINGSGAGPRAADIAAMANVPLWNISGQGDGTSVPTQWNTRMWDALCTPAQRGHYPPYGSDEPTSRAGSSQYHFWYVAGVGHSATDGSGNYMEMDPKVLAWQFAQVSDAVALPPAAPKVMLPASLDATVILANQTGSIVDNDSNVWTIVGGQVAQNGQVDGSTSNVTTLAWTKSVLWQCNTLGNWYAMSIGGGGWGGATTTNPITGLAPPPPPAPVFVPGPAGSGFTVQNGLIIAPDGSVFIARGVNIYLETIGIASLATVRATFPGINMIRLVFRFSYDTSAGLVAWIKTMTGAGIVVMLDDHVQGNSAPVATGGNLATELNWFKTHATTFKDNPYVWYQSQNEPGNGQNLASVAQHELDTYNAVRNTGNPHPVVLEVPCGGNKGIVGAQAKGYDGKGPPTPALYATMRNIVWDMHFYNFITVPSFGSDAAMIRVALMGSIAAAYGIIATQSIKSADGLVPVIIGEFGPSTTGNAVDPGGTATVQAVLDSGYGFLAFTWGTNGAGAGNWLCDTANPPHLTAYGRQVAAAIAAKAGAAPPVVMPPVVTPPVVVPPITVPISTPILEPVDPNVITLASVSARVDALSEALNVSHTSMQAALTVISDDLGALGDSPPPV